MAGERRTGGRRWWPPLAGLRRGRGSIEGRWSWLDSWWCLVAVGLGRNSPAPARKWCGAVRSSSAGNRPIYGCGGLQLRARDYRGGCEVPNLGQCARHGEQATDRRTPHGTRPVSAGAPRGRVGLQGCPRGAQRLGKARGPEAKGGGQPWRGARGAPARRRRDAAWF
jgi:hypothetical protein